MAAVKSYINPDKNKNNLQVLLWRRNKNDKTAEYVYDKPAPCTQLVPLKRSMLGLKASGDCSKPSTDRSKSSCCCRLCGQDQLLRLLDSSHPCVGDVEKYDAIIKECFGVDIPKDDLMICEECVINLKNTQRFSALIYAAFGKRGSNFSFSNEDSLDDSNNKLAIKTENAGTQTGPAFRRQINKTKIIRIIREKTTRLQVEPLEEQAMKAIINCSNCRHKYRINMPQKEWKDFLCPRCKMREEKTKWCMRCNISVPIEEYREHFEQHLKTRNTIRNMVKDSSASQPHLPNTFGDDFFREYNKKYGCAVCPRRYHTVDGLLDHINCEHSGDHRFGNCECFVCGKDMKMRSLLDKHMIGHAGKWIYECDTCKKMFRSKKGLSIHKKTHKKINKFTRCWY